MYISSVGGDFRVHVTRPDYTTAPDARQIDAGDGSELRTIPAGSLNGFAGFRRFLLLTVRKPGGKLVSTHYRPFCPNGTDRQRIDDSGPALPFYPADCTSGSPFMRGMVWGIEPGWAARAFDRGESVGWRAGTIPLRPGTYRLAIEITANFRSRFEIAPEHAAATIDLVVKRGRTGGGEPKAARNVLRAPAAADVPIVADPDPATLPDLVALPAWNMGIRRWRARDYLTFASTPWNAGPAPLVVEGFRRPGTAIMDAFQYFYDEAGAPVGKASAGTFDWDARPGHHHWHFLQFIRYAIVDTTTNAVVRSYKQSFCLAPTDPIDLTVTRAALTPWVNGLLSVCGVPGSKWVREVLPAGWGDTYFQWVAGQAFNVTKLPNGRYRVLVEVNPKGLIRETSAENNVALREIRLRGKPGRRWVEVSPWNGIER